MAVGGKSDEPGAVQLADVAASGSFTLQAYGPWTLPGSGPLYGTFPLTVTVAPYDYTYVNPWSGVVIHDVAMATVEAALLQAPLQIALAFDDLDGSTLGGSAGGDTLAHLEFSSKVPRGYPDTGIYFRFTLQRSGTTEAALAGTSIERRQ
jgi:hypothetical protein